jgi:hypothetical protein
MRTDAGEAQPGAPMISSTGAQRRLVKLRRARRTLGVCLVVDTGTG